MNILDLDGSVQSNLILRKGQTLDKIFQVLDIDGQYYDFTGHTVTAEAFSGPADIVPNIQFTVTTALGQIRIQMSAAEMARYRRRALIWFLWVTFPGGAKRLWVNGNLQVNEGTHDSQPNAEQILEITEGNQVTIQLMADADSGSLKSLRHYMDIDLSDPMVDPITPELLASMKRWQFFFVTAGGDYIFDTETDYVPTNTLLVALVTSPSKIQLRKL